MARLFMACYCTGRKVVPLFPLQCASAASVDSITEGQGLSSAFSFSTHTLMPCTVKPPCPVSINVIRSDRALV